MAPKGTNGLDDGTDILLLVKVDGVTKVVFWDPESFALLNAASQVLRIQELHGWAAKIAPE